MPSRPSSVSDVNAAVLAHPCPYCGARPHQACSNSMGLRLRASMTHHSRVYVAAEAGDLPLYAQFGDPS